MLSEAKYLQYRLTTINCGSFAPLRTTARRGFFAICQGLSFAPMLLRITPASLESIRRHGARDYPSECCGALLGKASSEVKQVTEVVALKNLRHDPGHAQELLPVDDLARETERNRFLIDPLEQLRVEKDARSRGLDVLGYYHSHPDHPARPSVYDREHAWPWYSYIIVSVEQGVAKELTCWVLAEDGGVFDSESVEVVGEDRAQPKR